jgi:UDP-N-acetylglucosamine:LPS N-acetylglucosamine transferase
MNATKKKVLFVSGSLGLGHVTRDLAIANELRKQNTDIELYWLAAPPASTILKDCGETLLQENDLMVNYNVYAEQSASKTGLNLGMLTLRALKCYVYNPFIFKKLIKRQKFDLIIGDESYEICVAMVLKYVNLKTPIVAILDFLGIDAMSGNILDKFMSYFCNVIWYLYGKRYSQGKNLVLFIGEQEDISKENWGFLLPNRRQHAHTHYHFISSVLSFNPQDYSNSSIIKSRLGYGSGPLVICSIGGTAIGKTLLDLCGRAYPIIREKVPNLRMVLVCGPRLSADSLDIPPGPDVKQYVPDLYQHFAACDLAVVQCGSTSTLELMALECPFIYFPLEGHCEQELTVASRVARHRAGVRMSYSKTTPESLAREVISNLGKKVDYVPVPISGAAEAARLIIQKL